MVQQDNGTRRRNRSPEANVTSSYSQAGFPLGRTVITPTARSTLHPEDVSTCIARHARGDWGECSSHDVQANNFAVLHRLRLLSVYSDRNGRRFSIVTEADRSTTTVLLPEDY